MSILTDLFDLFESESNAFAFLPAINFGYLYWKNTNPQTIDLSILILVIAVCSISFNILSGYNFGEFLETDGDVMGTRIALLFATIGLSWTIALGVSVFYLYDFLSTETIWPILLTAVTLVFIIITVSDLVLRLLPQYRPD